MLTLKSSNQNFALKLPTDIKELTPELLGQLTKDIMLPKHHAIIVLAYKVKLFNLAFEGADQKNTTFSVTPILAAINEDSDSVTAKIGEVVIVDRSSIERGHGVAIKTMATYTAAANYIKSDITLKNNVLSGSDGSTRKVNLEVVTDSKKKAAERITESSPNVFVLDFKIIYSSDIKGSFINNVAKDPFIEVVEQTAE